MKSQFHKPLLATAVRSFDGEGEDVGGLIAELRKTNDQMQAKMAELGNNEVATNLQGKMAEINAKLDDAEAKNAKLTRSIEEKKASESELAEKIEAVEKKLARRSAGTEEYAEGKKELKLLEAFAKSGTSTLDSGGLCIKGVKPEDMEQKYLRSDSNEDGGFLMDETLMDMIIKPITEISPVRQFVNTRQIDTLSATAYTRDSLLKFVENGEGEEPWTPNNSKYGKLRIPVHSMQGIVEVTNRALLGSRFDLESEISGDFLEAQAELQNRRFVKGDGDGRPEGFMTNSAIQRVNSGIANSFDFDDLISITGELKVGYNPIYAMNRKTLAFIRTLKDDVGNYVWREGNVGAGIPNQINGVNYSSEFIDMDDVGTNAEPVIYADFRRLYTVVDAFQAIFLRNPYKKDGFVQFSIEQFYGGQVVLPEAGKILKCAV